MEALIEQLARVLRQGPPLRLAVLFGSQAIGRARPASDVDIAILPEDPELPLDRELDLAARLSSATRREVDLVRIDRASALLRWEIARHGRLLLAEPAFEWVRFRAHTASEHAEMADVVKRAANLYARRLARPGR